MRKIILVLILINCVISINTQNDNLSDRVKDYEISLYQAWSLALPAIINDFNGTSHTTLEVESNSFMNTIKWQDFIKPAWNIYSRTDLLKQLQWLLDIGQNAEFNQYIRFLKNNQEITLKNIDKNYVLSSREKIGVKYILSIGDDAVIDGIKGYDLGRYIQLCRWGFQAGYINNVEAWEMISKIYPMVHNIFNSWDEYGKSYLLGRLLWFSIINAEASAVNLTNSVYNNLLKKPDGLWSIIPWDIDKQKSAYLAKILGAMYEKSYSTTENLDLKEKWYAIENNINNSEGK